MIQNNINTNGEIKMIKWFIQICFLNLLYKQHRRNKYKFISTKNDREMILELNNQHKMKNGFFKDIIWPY